MVSVVEGFVEENGLYIPSLSFVPYLGKTPEGLIGSLHSN
jgi:hypothetical protein